MANILVSGLINTETTVRVRQFPVSYYPIDYPFFGVNTAVSGVAYNISKALKTLGDDVTLVTMTGRDFPAEYIQSQLRAAGIGTDWRCAWQESCWIPPRQTVICCSSLLNFAEFVPLLINYNLCPQKLTKPF